jgi:hypothetical protein
MATITCSFAQATYTEGQTIVCNVTWSGNSNLCPIDFYMYSPNGTVRDSLEVYTLSGSDTLTFPTTVGGGMTGTWTSHGYSFTGVNCNIASGSCSGDCLLNSGATGSIGALDEAGSTWYHGPFYPSQTNAYIARPHVVNNGYTADTIYRKYVYKNSAGTLVAIQTFSSYMNIGVYTYYSDYITIPSGIQTCAVGSQCVRFGIKVWGTGESEPANPTFSWEDYV